MRQKGSSPITIILIIVIVLLIGVVLWQSFSATPSISQPVATSSPVSNPIQSWNLYTNNDLGFSINYPDQISKFPGSWEYKEFDNEDGNMWVGFRPSSVQEDYIWGVYVNDANDLEKIISLTGSQFDDRKETREEISLNGKNALLVTVTTDEFDGWIAKTIYVVDGDKVYSIGNGAVEIPEFEQFYRSFKITQ